MLKAKEKPEIQSVLSDSRNFKVGKISLHFICKFREITLKVISRSVNI